MPLDKITYVFIFCGNLQLEEMGQEKVTSSMVCGFNQIYSISFVC